MARDDWQIKAREWEDKSKYNSFNSFKGLTWLHSNYIPIAKWLKGEGELPPPIELSLDPGHLCNFGCGHCNAQRYLKINVKEIKKDMKLMPKKHLENLIDFTSDWGVRGVCIGGGGEPLMNKNVWKLPSYISNKGMQSSFATHGGLIDELIAEEMMYCRWVGVSVDSGTKETFERVHKSNDFEKVINNLKLLVSKKEKTKSNIDIAYKFLIRPDNWGDLYSAARLAKDIGARDFHARPVGLERKDFKQAMKVNYKIEEIHEQFHKCHELEKGDDFRVFTIMHKYNTEFKVHHTFKNCVSSSLMLQACADGNAYVCADHRIEERFRLTSHYPNPENIRKYWGSDNHRKLLQSINVDQECARCTYGEFARQIEEMAIGKNGKDPMCLDFP
jgi:MoaA/NifB/PqqE/SkfB family radical SAM enzyme